MDKFYSYPETLVEQIRQQKSWCNDPKYFKKVQISPSATIKMLMHGQQGVDKGINKSGKPIEVMGLLLGRPDTEGSQSFIISDALPLPIEGFETRVVADDENVINYMIDLGESVESTRKDKFCGWYHTHPFDLDGTSHCFLSNTDITTQLQWQRMEDPNGNPWLAIVIDPLYSIDKGKPEMMAFRVYPPEYTAPANETPDGKMIKDDGIRVSQWGACWNRYYKLEIEYFMSQLAQETLTKISNQFSWHKPFVTSNTNHFMTKDINDTNHTIHKITHQLDRIYPGHRLSQHQQQQAMEIDYEEEGNISGHEESSSSNTQDSSSKQIFKKIKQKTSLVSLQHSCLMCTQMTKKMLFCQEMHTLDSNSSSKNMNVEQFCQYLQASLIQEEKRAFAIQKLDAKQSITASSQAPQSILTSSLSSSSLLKTQNKGNRSMNTNKQPLTSSSSSSQLNIIDAKSDYEYQNMDMTS